MDQFITQIFAIGAIISHIFILFVLVDYLTGGKSKFIKWVGKNGLIWAFTVSFVSMLVSLYYSDVIGWTPCTLCWYQRIFMYSNVFVLGFAMFVKNGREVIPYGILLSFVGGIIAIYHVLVQFTENLDAVTCSIYSNISCSEYYFIEFGYITIPVLSLTAFILTIVFLLLQRRSNEK